MGLLLCEDGLLVFKTEYTRDDGVPELYVIVSGELYCGPIDAACVEVTQDCVDVACEAWELT